ncbi:protease [archaeon]|nr:protease [archaeon]|tara:strand:- start:228 stop:1376 length:1149 start_codon:yes stop_codon:yes gene_type:complete
MEILAPAGNFAMLQAAVDAGADAIYFGIKGFNMRESANNFEIEDLKEFPKVKKYLALNTIIYDSEIKKVKEILSKAKPFIDAIICWDMSVIKIANELNIPIHLSTQASVSNLESIKQYQKLGVKRFILARELSLEQIKHIKENTNAEIEIFIHGAMCVSYSGRCFLSQHLFNRSANRGKCIQPCRRKYKIIDSENNKELSLESQTVLSPKDLCTLPFIEEIIKLNLTSLKIEGRAKTPEYVHTVVKVYKQAINNPQNKEKLLKELELTYNRGFHDGFYKGLPTSDSFTKAEGNVAKIKKTQIGKVINYYQKNKVAVIKLYKNIKLGDHLLIQGNKTGNLKLKVESLQIENKPVEKAEKCLVALKSEKQVRENDKVYSISIII